MNRVLPSGYRMDCLTLRRSLSGIALVLLCSTFTLAQDSPGRFELGGNFTAIHFFDTSKIGPGVSTIGPGVEGDFNLGRHLALDGAFTWMPGSFPRGTTTTGLFGVKAGTRTQRFGFFGKVRPGFITFSNVVRDDTLTFGNGGFIPNSTLRLASLTQRALDLGGVIEYYPARHWAFRWDFGDTLLFQETGPTLTLVNVGTPPTNQVISTPGRTSSNFQFSTGVHYRF
jgi:hypothetical protein